MVLKPFVCVMMNLWVFVFKFLSQKMNTATTNLYKWVLCFVFPLTVNKTEHSDALCTGRRRCASCPAIESWLKQRIYPA